MSRGVSKIDQYIRDFLESIPTRYVDRAIAYTDRPMTFDPDTCDGLLQLSKPGDWTFIPFEGGIEKRKQSMKVRNWIFKRNAKRKRYDQVCIVCRSKTMAWHDEKWVVPTGTADYQVDGLLCFVVTEAMSYRMRKLRSRLLVPRIDESKCLAQPSPATTPPINLGSQTSALPGQAPAQTLSPSSDTAR